MGEQVMDGDLTPGGDGGIAGVFWVEGGQDGRMGEGRDVFRYGVVEREFSFFPEHQGCDGGDGFCLGGDPEDAVFWQLRFCVDVIVSVCFVEYNLTMAGDEGY